MELSSGFYATIADHPTQGAAIFQKQSCNKRQSLVALRLPGLWTFLHACVCRCQCNMLHKGFIRLPKVRKPSVSGIAGFNGLPQPALTFSVEHMAQIVEVRFVIGCGILRLKQQHNLRTQERYPHF